MTNRERLMKMSLYDLIMSVNLNRVCKLAVFTDEELTELCCKHKHQCDICIQKWLGRDYKQ